MVTVLHEPTTEIVSLDEMKLHLRIDHDDEDALIKDLITSARKYAEFTVCGKAFAEQTLIYYPTRLVGRIELPYPPLQSIERFEYKDIDGTTHGLTEDEDFYADVRRSAVQPVARWPTVSLHPVNPIEIEYVAGYAEAPADVQHAIKLLVGHWYEYREGVLQMGHNINLVPWGINALLQGHRTFGGVG